MKKRLILLLTLAVVVVLATAPVAMADHCRKCEFNRCAIALTGGKPVCNDSGGVCVLQGQVCTGPHPFAPEEPFEADFVVASVERLDEPPQPAPSEPQVASLETTRAVQP